MDVYYKPGVKSLCFIGYFSEKIAITSNLNAPTFQQL
jgi:hypothetical protein